MSSSQTPPPFCLVLAAILGFLGVSLGAFGAHGFKQILAENQLTEVYQTAVSYHLLHALVLLVVAQGRFKAGYPAVLCFSLGILVFSGSLYVLALTGYKKLGAITPIGGVLFLLGWLCLAKGVHPQNSSLLEAGSTR
jgi:uncharacterized membrane protein YgdD (TMEM256/DUF423 family)